MRANENKRKTLIILKKSINRKQNTFMQDNQFITVNTRSNPTQCYQKDVKQTMCKQYKKKKYGNTQI
jgi:hypothetical protein